MEQSWPWRKLGVFLGLVAMMAFSYLLGLGSELDIGLISHVGFFEGFSFYLQRTWQLQKSIPFALFGMGALIYKYVEAPTFVNKLIKALVVILLLSSAGYLTNLKMGLIVFFTCGIILCVFILLLRHKDGYLAKNNKELIFSLLVILVMFYYLGTREIYSFDYEVSKIVLDKEPVEVVLLVKNDESGIRVYKICGEDKVIVLNKIDKFDQELEWTPDIDICVPKVNDFKQSLMSLRIILNPDAFMQKK